MKLINTNGLPQAVFEALQRKEYSKGDADISVSELIDSPRIRQLKKKHDHEIELEAESLLASFLGTAFHKAIETGTVTGTAERRLDIEVSGWKLSGGMDHYHKGVLTDYKTANIYKTINADDGVISEWENQLNVYAFILQANGIPVKGLKLFTLFKDWNARGFSEANRKASIFQPWVRAGYPEKSWLYFDVPLWTPAKAEAYVIERVSLHQAAEKVLPLCTKDEVWKNAGRCKKYCSVAKFCTQHTKQSKTGLMAKGETNETTEKGNPPVKWDGSVFKVKRR